MHTKRRHRKSHKGKRKFNRRTRKYRRCKMKGG